MRNLALLMLLALGACAPLTLDPLAPAGVMQPRAPQAEATALNLAAGTDRLKPVAEQECRRRVTQGSCDFMVVVDTRPGLAPNAFQSVDADTGRPVIGFTQSLLTDMENSDELAFVFAHEAAHHILGHLPRRDATARGGALILGALASLGGADPTIVREAQMIGAEVVARRYTRELEIEADMLGTQLAWAAGFNPERGAAYFTRIPDPGNRFLSSHPPNAERLAAVQAALGRLPR